MITVIKWNTERPEKDRSAHLFMYGNVLMKGIWYKDGYWVSEGRVIPFENVKRWAGTEDIRDVSFSKEEQQ